MDEEIKYELKVFQSCGEWRYTLHDGGWEWGHFKTEARAREVGSDHVARAIKFGNDWGRPMSEVRWDESWCDVAAEG